MIEQLYDKLYSHFGKISLQKPNLQQDLYQKPRDSLVNPLDLLKDKIKHVLKNDEDIIDFPSVEGPDLVINTKKVRESQKNNFSSVKETADWIFNKLKNSQDILELVNVEQVGIFINLYFKDSYIQQIFNHDFAKPHLKKLIVDYASPNVAKQMSVGHLRSSVIGQSLVNIHRILGWQVLRWNYIGDWGTPFGKLIFAFEKFYQGFETEDPNLLNMLSKWGSGEKLIRNFLASPVDVMTDLYAGFRLLPFDEKEEQARKYFALLEEGDHKIGYLWKLFRHLSIEQYKQTFQKLGIEFDLWWGEAFAQDYVDKVIEILDKKGYIVESQGALVVYFKKEGEQWIPLKGNEHGDNVEVMLLKKQDGTTLYATRDLATLWLRVSKLKADKILYVVGAEQSLHFQLLFSLAKELGWIDKVEVKHVEFGLMLMGGEKMSSRKGNVVYLEDLIEALKTNILREFNEKIDVNTSLKLAVASLIFNDLKSDRIKNVNFDPKEISKLNGDTGTYILYGYVRLKNLLMKLNPSVEVDLNHLNSLEKKLLKKIFFVEEILARAANLSKPHLVAQFLLEIVKDFNSRYTNSPKIVEMEVKIQKSKYVFLDVLHKGFIRLMQALNLPLVAKM